MKLTVCFGHVKVIVPCGEGDLTVKDLVDKATWRYVKASLKENVDIDVKYLQTEDDAILDSDDVIADVCDDKDRLIAIFQEKTSSLPAAYDYQTTTSSKSMAPKHSVSSTGSEFTSITEQSTSQIDRVQPVAPPPGFDSKKPPIQNANLDNRSEKRSGREWRREAPRKSNERLPSNSQSLHSSSSSSTPVSSPDTTKDALGFNRFDRNLNRKSLSTAHPMLYSWIDAQERLNERDSTTNTGPHANDKRLSESRGSFSGPSVGDYDDADEISSTSSEEIELETRLKDDYGLKVQGYRNADGKELGLIVHEIKNDSVVGKHGSLNIADRITEVNGVNLRGMSNSEAEAILNEALADGPLKLKRTRSHHFIRASIRNVSMEKHTSLPKVPEAAILSSKEAPMIKPSQKDNEIHEAPIEDPRSEAPIMKPIQGNKIFIELSKGSSGLGFSITSRDVVTGGQNPVYVKNILPNGAAVQDGRLKVGDQIIEINRIDVSSKDQGEVVKILKKASGTVKLLVNRLQSKEVIDQDEHEEAMETVSNDSGISTIKEEYLSITIPLNDLGSAGLGISVKGKSTEDNIDLGIFVKSIIKGGAAAKDGRLKAEDRLLQINNVSLDGLSNDKAMNALRDTLKESVKQQEKIKLVVSRKSKSEQSHLVADVKADFQMPFKPTVPSLIINEASSLEQRKSDSQVSPTRPPRREKRPDGLPIRSDVRKISESGVEMRAKTQLAPEAVKISSSEIPVTQPCKPIMIDRTSSADSRRGQLVEVKTAVFPNEKEFFYQNKPDSAKRLDTEETSATFFNPPTYNETMKRLSTSSSDTGSNKGSIKSSRLKTVNTKESVETPTKDNGLNYLIDDYLDDTDLIRTMSTSSRFSMDSLMLSPEAMPFSRDAFGRLSMSERKGRAHLDATKSTLYSKLKKCKSLENVHSVHKINGDLPTILLESKSATTDHNTAIVPLHEVVRRTESLDTLLSNPHIASDEEEIFQRNTNLSKSTPWYAQRAVSPKAVNLRSRSTAWNDSFRNAVDRSTVFYTQNGDATMKRQENAIPITLTSNANYDSSQQTKKKAGILKGIGNLLKKGKPRRSEWKNESREKDFTRTGRGTSDPEQLIDFSRRPRPHSMHEGLTDDGKGPLGGAVRERELAKREREDKLVSSQRDLQKVQASEEKMKSVVTRRKSDDKGDPGRKHSQQTYGVREETQTRYPVQNGSSRQSDGYKSLLKRGQERILQREKNQDPVVQQGVVEQKPAARQEAFRSKRSLVSEYREPERQNVREENPPRSGPRNATESIEDSRVPAQTDRHRETADNVREKITELSHSKSDVTERSWKGPPVTYTNSVPLAADTGESYSSKRHLPEVPLFYYGHSSLPRKFIMNNNTRKKSLVDNKPTDYDAAEGVKSTSRCQQPVGVEHRKQSSYSVGDKPDVSKKVYQTSIMDQTEALIRAQQGHELNKRNAAQRRGQAQTNVGQTTGTVTISHAANI